MTNVTTAATNAHGVQALTAHIGVSAEIARFRPNLLALEETSNDADCVVEWKSERIKEARQSAAVPITVAYGDGIGPEIMAATLEILAAAGAKLKTQVIEVGESVYNRGFVSGIGPDGWRSLRETRIFLKAPVATPQGGGLKSVNVTVRKAFGLFANVRPCVAFAPFIPTRAAGMDIIVVRENEEDLYSGIEHRQTDDVHQCLKLVSRSGSERVIRYAFELARMNGRNKVTCLTKDTIMKMTDGLFHRVFNEIAQSYPGIESEHLIIDHGIAKLVKRPEYFDVIVAPNFYGDIVSDVAAQIAGSVGLVGSANVGPHGAMFEAVHGTAPELTGTDTANPSGLIRAALMMLQHIGQTDAAARIQNAWLKTLEDGLHTVDIVDPRHSDKCVGTQAFAHAIIERLNESPRILQARTPRLPIPDDPVVRLKNLAINKEMVGVDVFLHWNGESPQALAEALQAIDGNGFVLSMITNRGVKVWPNGQAESFCTDHWRCRFMAANGLQTIDHDLIAGLLRHLAAANFDFIKIETLCSFNDEPGYSLGYGQ